MGAGTNFALLLVGIVGTISAWILLSAGRRTATDVLVDLQGESGHSTMWDDEEGSDGARVRSAAPHFLKDAYGARGLFSKAKRQAFDRRRVITAALIIALPLLISALAAPSKVSLVVVSAVLGVSLAYLVDQHILRSARRCFMREVEFFLPIVMERVVMAVQAGLDVLPALEAILELDEEDSRLSESRGLRGSDCVTQLLSMVVGLSEAGLSFEDSLREVSNAIDCAALKHAFIHLAVAQQEGGELVVPLKELSDSTQLYYQETIEEEIAGMPVKATLPLLCTFSGLILFFITSPLMQVMGLVAKATPK